MPEFENLAPYEQPEAPKGKRILPVAPHVSPGGEFRPTRRDNRRRDEPILRPKKVTVPDLLETSEMEKAFRQADKAQRVEDAAKGIKRPGPLALWWREFLKGLRKKLGLKKKPAQKKRAKRGGRDNRKPARNEKRPTESKGGNSRGNRGGRGRGQRDGGKGGNARGGRPENRSGKGQNAGKPAKKQARGGDQPKARKQARKRPPQDRRDKRDEKPANPKPAAERKPNKAPAEAAPKASKPPKPSTTPKAEVNGETRAPRKRRNRNRGGAGNRPTGPGRED